MLEIAVLAVLAFFLSLLFDRPRRRSKTKFKDKMGTAVSAAGTVVFWGIVMIAAIVLFFVLCKFIFFGSL